MHNLSALLSFTEMFDKRLILSLSMKIVRKTDQKATLATESLDLQDN